MKNQRQVLHFTHHQKEVFIIQVAMTLAVLMAIIYSLYLITFGRNTLPGSVATLPVSSSQEVISAQELLDKGISEAQFIDSAPTNIETSKLESLFPSLK